MLNDGMPPTPGKLLGTSAKRQRLLINFQPVTREHWVAVLTNKFDKVSDKVSEKESPKVQAVQAKCPNSRNAKGVTHISLGRSRRSPRTVPPDRSERQRRDSSELATGLAFSLICTSRRMGYEICSTQVE